MSELEPLESNALITRASERGVLSPTSARALQRPSVGDQIDQALEDSYGVETAGEVVLLTMMPDDSASMTIARKNDSVMLGHNELLSALRKSASAEKILLQTRYLNGHMLNPFQPLKLCSTLTAANYRCTLGTPLFEQTIVTLGAVLAKTEELLQQGAARVRSATLIMSDAEATGAAELQEEVASVISDMRNVGDHIVAGMGFSSGNDEPFRRGFKAMGIDTQLIFTAHGREDILRAFRTFGNKALELKSSTDSSRVPEA